MNHIHDELDELHLHLKLKRLNPVWAKLEILLGLIAASTGLLVGVHAILQFNRDPSWATTILSVVLQTLGCYLALAGHRSHLYQSKNKLTAFLASQIQVRDKTVTGQP
jgi:hypothetical protein